MSRRRYLSTEISTDRRVNQLAREGGDFAVLLYTWLIPHANDQGAIETDDPEEILMLVMPGRRDRSPEEVTAALALMRGMGLLDPTAGRIVFPAESFYRYQTYIKPSNRRASAEGCAEERRISPQDGAKERGSEKSSGERRKTPRNAASLSPSPSPSPSPSLSLSHSLSPTQKESEEPPAGAGSDAGASGASRFQQDPLEDFPILHAFWEELLLLLRQAHPNAKTIPEMGDKRWMQWRGELAALARLDGYGEQDIADCLRWLFLDEKPAADGFSWRAQVQSVPALRKRKSADEATKFAKIFERWSAQGFSSTQGMSVYRGENKVEFYGVKIPFE